MRQKGVIAACGVLLVYRFSLGAFRWLLPLFNCLDGRFKRMFVIQAANSIFENANPLNLINPLNPLRQKAGTNKCSGFLICLPLSPFRGLGWFNDCDCASYRPILLRLLLFLLVIPVPLPSRTIYR